MVSALSELSSSRQFFSCRIQEHRPIAHQQWLITLKPENGEFPDFDPGNFCMLSLSEFADPLLPRPLAIFEKKNGAYTFIYRVVGKMTRLLATLPGGSRIHCLGPLGRGISKKFLEKGSHCFIAGGVGYSSLYPLIESAIESNNKKVSVFYGVRKSLEIIRKSSVSVEFASDDGSIGYHGRLHELIEQQNIKDFDYFYVCGPTAMMKALHKILPPEKTFYFLEEAMGCGFGICMGCVVKVENEKKEVKNLRSCLHGPIFLGSSLAEWKSK